MIDDIKVYSEKLDAAVTTLKSLDLHRLDRESEYLSEGFSIAYDHQLFNLHQYNTVLQNYLKLELFSALTPISGSLAFLAVQILAANRIMQSNSFPRASMYYKKRCGIIINHLRAPVTIIDSVISGRGYALTGKLIWASGYKIFDTLVVGFHHDGVEMQAVMPFKPQIGCVIGDADDTFVGVSMNTVTIDLDQYVIPAESIISSHPIGHYTKQKSISKTVHMAFYGIGLGAIDALDDEELKREATKILESYKDDFMSSNSGEHMDELRIKLFEFIQKLITTGMTLYGGKSILSVQRLQQYYRELIMFNSNGLNNTIKELFRTSFLKSVQS